MQVSKALRVFAETGDLHKTAETAGCHVSTIRRLLMRSPESFGQVQKAIAAKAYELSAAAQEIALERVGELNAYQAAITSKIASQQAQELTDGQPAVEINIQMVEEVIEMRDSVIAEMKRRELMDGQGNLTAEGKEVAARVRREDEERERQNGTQEG